MQTTIATCLIGMFACSMAMARPQNNINNFPYRPTFSDLDTYNYYTTPNPYQQNVRIWPYIIDQAVSPLYNWNWNGNGYNNYNNGYYNTVYGYTTSNPYWNYYNTQYTGKK